MFKRYVHEDNHVVNSKGFINHIDSGSSRDNCHYADLKDLVAVDPDIDRMSDKAGDHNCPNYNKQCDITAIIVRR